MLVLDGTQWVLDNARHLSVDEAAIDKWAADVPSAALRPKAHELLAHLPGSQAELANLVLLIDSLNFCFWSPDPISIGWRGKTYYRFEAMFISLMLTARYDPEWFNAEYWLEVPREEIRQVLSGKGKLLLMDERERILRETARALIDRFDGQFIHAIESVNEKAWPLAVLLMTNFDSFRDVSGYHEKPVYFMKRAQICALDISIAWETHEHPALKGLEQLTAFADYRVPQALRRLGVLVLSDALADTIDTQREIEKDSEEEVEIRAASIQAVEKMKNAVAKAGKSATAWQIDWYLWELARGDDGTEDHHRTRTIYY